MESFGLAAPIPRSLSDWFLHFRLETGRAQCLWAQSEAVVGPTTFTHRGPHTCEIPITCSEDPIGFGVAGFGLMDSYAHTHQNFNQILPHLEASLLFVLTCYRFVWAYRFPSNSRNYYAIALFTLIVSHVLHMQINCISSIQTAMARVLSKLIYLKIQPLPSTINPHEAAFSQHSRSICVPQRRNIGYRGYWALALSLN